MISRAMTCFVNLSPVSAKANGPRRGAARTILWCFAPQGDAKEKPSMHQPAPPRCTIAYKSHFGYDSPIVGFETEGVDD
jgi:hypothetical protein